MILRQQLVCYLLAWSTLLASVASGHVARADSAVPAAANTTEVAVADPHGAPMPRGTDEHPAEEHPASDHPPADHSATEQAATHQSAPAQGTPGSPGKQPKPPGLPTQANSNVLDGQTIITFGFEREEDRDYDDQPDTWSRRAGALFPGYVKLQIDSTLGYKSSSSLRCDLNGAPVATYSPALRIDPLHTYYMSGWIRSRDVESSSAAISVSLLDAQHRRIERVMSAEIQDSRDGWLHVEVGPLPLPPETRFLVLGCHVLPSELLEISGQFWFDEVRLSRAPRLKIENQTPLQTLGQGRMLEAQILASGLEGAHDDLLKLEVTDISKRVVSRQQVRLGTQAVSAIGDDLTHQPMHREDWKYQPTEPGFYRLNVSLERSGKRLIDLSTTFAVVEPAPLLRTHSEFGWSMQQVPSAELIVRLPAIAEQAQCGWVKVPVWAHASDALPEQISGLARLFDDLALRRIDPVGVLDLPPAEIRGKFANVFPGVMEVFSLTSAFWGPSLKPALARYSSTVRHWQLGADNDLSFLGSGKTDEVLSTVSQEIRHVGLNAEIGLPWSWEAPPPANPSVRQPFVLLNSQSVSSASELQQRLQALPATRARRWLLLPTIPPRSSPKDRAAELVRWMVAAKRGGADVILAPDVINDQSGLLSRDGTPTELFLPWRTAASALRQAEYLGSLTLPTRTQNAVFGRPGEAIIVMWNPEGGQESLYLGPQAVSTDVWGRSTSLAPRGDPPVQSVTVGSHPILLRQCDLPIARWQLDVSFAAGRIRSENGSQPESLLGTNTFAQGVSGTARLVLPPGWTAEPSEWNLRLGAGESFNLPTYLTLPPNASLGPVMMAIDFDVTAEQRYRFRVYQKYQIGLGDVLLKVTDRKLEDGRLEIEQVVINQTSPPEILDLRCSLFVPGQRRQKLQITKLGLGEDRKIYLLPDADLHRGRELWLRLEQEGGRRVMNYRWKVGDEWD